jgi:hypothetical protein
MALEALVQQLQAQLMQQEQAQQQQQAQTAELAARLQQALAPAHAAAAAPAPAARGPTFRPVPPAPFTGDAAGSDVTTWLFSAEAFFQQFPTDDSNAFRLRQVTGLLREPALTWWQLRSMQDSRGGPALPQTWDAFRAELIQSYRPVDAEHRDRAALANVRQTGTVAAYIGTFNSLLLRVPDISVADQVFRFTEGLKHPTVVHVRLMRPETLQHAMEFAARADASAAPSRAAPGRSSGPTPMELGAIGDGDADDGNELAAINQQRPPRPPRPPAAAGRSAGTSTGVATSIPKMTEAIRAECIRLGLCFRCRKAGHRTGACTAFDAARPNA